MRRARALVIPLVVATASALNAQQRGAGGSPPAARPAPPLPDPFRFQMMGPAEGGRISAVTGVPGDARVWYLGAASGGIWKSVDSGATFRPVFDSMPVQAIGALAVAPSKPSIVWAGTGEAWAIRDADLFGDGVYKSSDSGTTWTNMGLAETGRIQRIIVHPTNPNIVFVCALGRATGPQEERGVYRTTDGGKAWKHVLSVDANTGCSGLTIDEKNPQVLFAGTWEVVMHTWAMFSGGPGSGIYVTRNGGDTWKKVEHPGLPKSPLGKIDVAVAPTNSKRVYALIQTADQGSVWRSDDGGVSWAVINHQRPLIGRAGYYIHLAVSSGNADEILLANSSFFRSTDGGKSFAEVQWGGDNHDIWIDPKNPNHFGLTNDLNARLTTDHGKSFLQVVLPIAQMYHVAVDNQTPYWVYGNRQDNGTMRGPSTAPEAGTQTRGIAAGNGRGRGGGRGNADSTAGRGGRGGRGGARSDSTGADSLGGGGRGAGGGTSTWDHGLGGCESGFTLPDLTNPDIVWASCYGNQVTRYDHTTKRARSVSPGVHTLDSPPDQLKYRCHWTPPLAIDPFDHNTVYYGCQLVFKTSNGGQTWIEASPDLSTNDKSRVVSSGGLVPDNLGQFYGEVVFAIAPSEIQRGLIWAGTNDGQLWNTKDGGTTWTNVSKAMTGLPAWGTIRKIEPSHFDAATAYVAVDFHMMDNRKPYVYKTTDFGQTWSNVTGDLPAKSPLDYVMAVAENPNRKGMLFAGTGHAFYYSLDDGTHWTEFDQGLPHSAVSWIVVPKAWHDVVVSTYGRGVFILKDIGPLEQIGQIADADVMLYPPHPGYRQARAGRADITFALKTASPRPARVEILDSAGAVVRALQAPTRAGYNRAIWDLRYDGPKRVDLRTVAPDNPHIFDDPRFRGRTTRPIIHWGIQNPQVSGPIGLAGQYSVRLTVNGKTLTQPLTILKDPDVKSADADLVASTKAQLRIRDDMNASVDMINKLEVMRKQIEDQRKAAAAKPDVVSSLADLEKKMLDVELRLLSRSDMNSDDKYYVEPFKIYLNLIWLSGEVGNGAGDVAGGADYRPTDAAMAWLGDIDKDLDAAKAAYKKLVDVDLAEFNTRMTGKIPVIAETVRPVVP
ncbi:MAG: sialidase [bacterium]